MSHPSPLWQRSACALWRRSGQTLVVKPHDTDELVLLDRAGLELWVELAEPLTFEELSARLAALFGVEPEQVAADLHHQQSAHEDQPLGGGPAVVALAHAAAARPGMNGFRPGAGRRHQPQHPVDQRPDLRRAALEQRLDQMQREIGVQPGVDVFLIERAVVQPGRRQPAEGGDEPGFVGRDQPQRIERDQ